MQENGFNVINVTIGITTGAPNLVTVLIRFLTSFVKDAKMETTSPLGRKPSTEERDKAKNYCDVIGVIAYRWMNGKRSI